MQMKNQRNMAKVSSSFEISTFEGEKNHHQTKNVKLLYNALERVEKLEQNGHGIFVVS